MTKFDRLFTTGMVAMLTLAAVPMTISSQARPAAKKPAAPSRVCVMPNQADAWFKTQRDFQKLDNKRDWTNDSLRGALIDAASLMAQTDVYGDIEIGATVSAPTAFLADENARAVQNLLRDMASKRQWPTRSMVGVAGVHAAWLVSRNDTTLAKAAMHRMMEAGPGEASPADVAVLEDKLRLANGRKQIYATQMVPSKTGGYEPAPTEDLAHVDMRREAAGLPKLAQALCSANARWGGK